MRVVISLSVSLFTVAFACSLPACSSSDEARRSGYGPGRGDPAELFQRLDNNKDGVLSWDEFKSIPTRNRSVEDIFQRLDTDSDGLITREELMNMRQVRPDGDRGRPGIQ